MMAPTNPYACSKAAAEFLVRGMPPSPMVLPCRGHGMPPPLPLGNVRITRESPEGQRTA